MTIERFAQGYRVAASHAAVKNSTDAANARGPGFHAPVVPRRGMKTRNDGALGYVGGALNRRTSASVRLTISASDPSASQTGAP